MINLLKVPSEFAEMYAHYKLLRDMRMLNGLGTPAPTI